MCMAYNPVSPLSLFLCPNANQRAHAQIHRHTTRNKIRVHRARILKIFALHFVFDVFCVVEFFRLYFAHTHRYMERRRRLLLLYTDVYVWLNDFLFLCIFYSHMVPFQFYTKIQIHACAEFILPNNNSNNNNIEIISINDTTARTHAMLKMLKLHLYLYCK